MDFMTKEDWDLLAKRLNGTISVEKGDTKKDIQDKLTSELKGTTTGKSLLKPRTKSKLWKNILPRIMKLNKLKVSNDKSKQTKLV
jgi:hypothetical protein